MSEIRGVKGTMYGVCYFCGGLFDLNERPRCPATDDDDSQCIDIATVFTYIDEAFPID